MKRIFSAVLLLLPFFLFGQKTPKVEALQPPFTPGVERTKAFQQRQNLIDQSLVAKVPFRSVGPSVFSGRVVDMDVRPDDPTHFFVAYASGGLWKTTNNGTTFEPLFDNEAVMTIGDIAVNWNTNTIWIGTGENNSSRSSYSGVGMYRSTDGGKTWEHRGLEESHHIGRIVLHPDNPDIVWVAVLGHLYSPNKERGVYKTTDGGKSWKKVLYVNDNSGAIDMVMEPGNPSVLYAATWERTRRAWDFTESGKGSGIWKSVDGGENWKMASGSAHGFPLGEGVGRIGLAIAKNGGGSVLYAVLDNQNRRPKEEKPEDKDKLKKEIFRTISKDSFLNLDNKKLDKFLKDNDFDEKYTAEKVKKLVKTDKIAPTALVEFLETANSLLFDTEVIGAEVYKSTDGGGSWTKTHDGFLDDVVYSYGYYFSQIRISPQNPEKIYIVGVPVLKSEDGGKTFKSINEDNVHVDHHALWCNPNRPEHLILGNDGGINISFDDGKNWVRCNTPPVGQFYAVAVDMAEPYNVYGGTQDNGVWVGPNTYEAGVEWQMDGNYPYKFLLGGDGMQVAIDTRDNNTVYTGYQFGNYFRIDKKLKKSKYITPKHDLGERPFRWNWQTPIQLSVHNQDVLYMGSHLLHRSFDQGEKWEAISGDLTKGGIKGDVPYGTLTTIHESSKKFGLIYTGSDDGVVSVTRDGGNKWTNITTGLPENYYVSRVQASSHELARVYVALNGYRWDNFTPMVYVSEDYGATWARIGTNLPLEAVNVIREDPENPDLLYVGTDHGLYVSLDRGKNFMAMKEGLPAVSVHDVVVHPLDKDLIVGTHGRSIYIADVAQVQQLADSVLQKELFVFELEKRKASSGWGNSYSKWSEPNEPKFSIPVFVNASGEAEITISADDSLILKTWKTDVSRGLNFLKYDFTFDESQKESYEKWLNAAKKKDDDDVKLEKSKGTEKWYLKKGVYTVKFKKGAAEMSRKLTLE